MRGGPTRRRVHRAIRGVPYIREASAKYDVPEKWIREVMRQESGGNLYGRGGQLITSGAGAMGLMQVMPATYDDLRGRYRELGDDPYDPHNNILAGSAYVREMYDIYGAPGFLAAYNAGPGRLDDYLTRNRTLPLETRRYVAAIGPRINGLRAEPPVTRRDVCDELASRSIFRLVHVTRISAATQFASAAPTPSVARPIVLNPPAPAYAEPAYVAPESKWPKRRPGPFIKLSPQPAEPIVVADAAPASARSSSSARSHSHSLWSSPKHPRRASSRHRGYEPGTAIRADAQRYEPTPRYRSTSRRRSVRHRPALPRLADPRAAGPATEFARGSSVRASRQFVRRWSPDRGCRDAGAAADARRDTLPPQNSSRFRRTSMASVLIPTATAAPIHHVRGPISSTSGAWAVQVGAFANQNLAQSATVAARQNAHNVLGGAQIGRGRRPPARRHALSRAPWRPFA